MSLFQLIGETIRFVGFFVVPGQKDILERNLEDLRSYREELERKGSTKSYEADEVYRIRDALKIVREAKESTLCSSCKRELEGMEQDMMKHLTKLATIDMGRETMREMFPGSKYEELPEEAREAVKKERDLRQSKLG